MAAAGAAPILEIREGGDAPGGDAPGLGFQANGACGRCTYSKAEWCTYPSPSFEAHGELLRRVAFLAPWVGFDEASTAQRATVSTPLQRRSSRTAACQCAAQHSPTPPPHLNLGPDCPRLLKRLTIDACVSQFSFPLRQEQSTRKRKRQDRWSVEGWERTTRCANPREPPLNMRFLSATTQGCCGRVWSRAGSRRSRPTTSPTSSGPPGTPSRLQSALCSCARVCRTTSVCACPRASTL